MLGHRVDVDAPGRHRHQVIRTQRRSEKHVFHVIDAIRPGKVVGGTRRVPRSPREIVAVKNFAGHAIGHDQIQIVDQFDAGGRIARGIGPHQGKTQRPGPVFLVGQFQIPTSLLAGRQRVFRILIPKAQRSVSRPKILGLG